MERDISSPDLQVAGFEACTEMGKTPQDQQGSAPLRVLKHGRDLRLTHQQMELLGGTRALILLH